MSIQDDIKASLDTLFNTVVRDELGVIKPTADQYLTAIVGNPDPLNLVGQSTAFFVASQGQLGKIGGIAVGDTAASLKALIDLEADKLLNQPAGTTATTVAAAASTATTNTQAASQSAAS